MSYALESQRLPPWERIVYTVSTLDARVLEWVSAVVGPGSAVEVLRALTGGTSSTLFALRIRRQGGTLELVLRLFTNEQWLSEEPDLARHEAAALRQAARIDLPTPELIAYDEMGESCGLPAVLMTHLPGRVDLEPADLDRWLWQLAEAAIQIHTIEAPAFPWRYYPYNDMRALAVPTWTRLPKLWERAIEIIAGPPPSAEPCFIHRDYHPSNVLWQDGRISGVVDWVNACRGASGFDVAHCRLNLQYLHGLALADRFLEAYQSLAGSAFQYHPYWDLIALAEVLPGPPGVYQGWLDFGVRHLSAEVMVQRVDQYLASVLRRL